mmetsp:Transcript_9583/g.14112  ORF Transcript_9583/g.14112 Transcript_9583/m.14112 type:complete len:327 (+) Transcript_9583:364-1344(+)
MLVEEPASLDVDGYHVQLFLFGITTISTFCLVYIFFTIILRAILLQLTNLLLCLYFLIVCVVLFFIFFLLVCFLLHLLLLHLSSLGLFGNPFVRYDVFLPINVIEYLLNGGVCPNQLQGSFGPDALDGIAIIATEQNTQINKFIRRETQPINGLLIIHLLQITLAGIGKGHLPQQDGTLEGERVHVLRPNAVDQSLATERGCLCLSLAGCINNWHAHQFEQSLTFIILLRTSPHETLGLLRLLLQVSLLLCFLESLLGLIPLLPPLHELTRFDIGRLTIEDVDWSDALGEESDGAIEDALDVRGGFSFCIREHGCGIVGPSVSDRD